MMALDWKKGGVLLGLVFFAAVLLVKPIGVSTQFVVFDGIIWDMVDPSVIEPSPTKADAFVSTNAYLNKSDGQYAKEVANPLNYNIVFVLAMIAGAFVSSLLRGGVPRMEKPMPPVWRSRFGDAPLKRYLATFVAGILVLYGARMAGGCTSGHMMSGMMQMAISGYIFAAGAFAAGIPLAIFLFRKGD